MRLLLELFELRFECIGLVSVLVQRYRPPWRSSHGTSASVSCPKSTDNTLTCIQDLRKGKSTMAEVSFPGQHTTTTTVTSSTVVQTNIRFDPQYLKTIPGILKVVQVILDLPY
ncbi:hypothetical protein evm_000062 [Chilo suppressalis]|nr:hypothetical protein evm_000062 [Chilo suppressalis]